LFLEFIFYQFHRYQNNGISLKSQAKCHFFLILLPHVGNGGRCESAGINRHRVRDERALHERSSCSIIFLPNNQKRELRIDIYSFFADSFVT
jgi:hypothetical protein